MLPRFLNKFNMSNKTKIILLYAAILGAAIGLFLLKHWAWILVMAIALVLIDALRYDKEQS